MEEEKKNLLESWQPEEEELKVDKDLGPVYHHPEGLDVVKKTLEEKDANKLRELVQAFDSHTLAALLEEESDEILVFFFRAVKSDDSAEVFTLLSPETKKRLIEAFSTDAIQKLLEEMSTDNVVDFVDDLPANLVHKVLRSASKEDRERINSYLRFKDDSAGTLMTCEYLSFRETDNVRDAIDKIREEGPDMETIWFSFVTDEQRRLVGTLRLDHLLEADPVDSLSSVMERDYPKVDVDTDKEEVVRAFRHYDISVMPVTNSTGRMVGIITFDDVLDAANAEISEDIAIQSAVTPSEKPYSQQTVFGLVKGYVVWIIVLLMLNTFTSSTLSYLQNTLNAIPLLLAFIPTIMGTNGNASDQTCTVVTRELALGHITHKNYFKTIFKEFKASLLTALIMAFVSFLWILVELYSGIITLTDADQQIITSAYGSRDALFLSVAGLIGLTFLIVIIIAKWLGATLPMLAKLVHLDPAVMSQPLISNILDIISICVYVLLANLVMQGLPPLFG